MSQPTIGFVSTLLLAGSAVCAAIADDVPPKPVDGSIPWLYSYADGKRLATETGKPMFVVFRCER